MYTNDNEETIVEVDYVPKSLYIKFFKRVFDILLALCVLLFFWWLYLVLIILVKIKLGGPVFFKQPRPGKKDKNGHEKIFNLIKFRSMLNLCDENGNLLPDEKRLTKFGKWFRATSLDELPEIFNILKGDMSFVGPRPVLIKDLYFMDDTIRNRHNILPGLTGLAQVSGRNAIDWENKFECDLKYVKSISFLSDIKILFKTVAIVFKREGITDSNGITCMNYGDYLLTKDKITKEQYDKILLEHKN